MVGTSFLDGLLYVVLGLSRPSVELRVPTAAEGEGRVGRGFPRLRARSIRASCRPGCLLSVSRWFLLVGRSNRLVGQGQDRPDPHGDASCDDALLVDQVADRCGEHPVLERDLPVLLYDDGIGQSEALRLDARRLGI